MDGATFILPAIPPDFAVMDRETLESYAAEVDHRLRAQTAKVMSDEGQLSAFFWAMSRTHSEFSHITPLEAKVLLALQPTTTNKFSLLDALYSGSPDEPEVKIIDVLVCKLRKKLVPLGLAIRTVWGQGYEFPDRSRLMDLVEQWSRSGQVPSPDRAALRRVEIAKSRPKHPPVSAAVKARIVQQRLDGVRPADIAKAHGASVNQVYVILRQAQRQGVNFPDLRGAGYSS